MCRVCIMKYSTWKMACSYHEVALQFLLKTDDSVPSRTFSNVNIKEFNAKGKCSFPNAFVNFDSGFSVPLFLFWQESIFKLMERKIVKKENTKDDSLFEDLISFLEDGNYFDTVTRVFGFRFCLEV